MEVQENEKRGKLVVNEDGALHSFVLLEVRQDLTLIYSNVKTDGLLQIVLTYLSFVPNYFVLFQGPLAHTFSYHRVLLDSHTPIFLGFPQCFRLKPVFSPQQGF
jgi:hypothetical protein